MVCSSEVQKSGGVRGREKAAKCAVQKKRGGGVGGGSANLPLMTLFSSLLPPKAISCGFLLLVCWRRRVYSFLHGLRERGC